jgi:thiamine pyrophosphokinase
MAQSGTGLLLIGGEGPSREALRPLLPEIACTIAADSGFDLGVALGLIPDLLVGDLDSVASTAALASFPPERIRRYPADKDETDTEIGLRLLREMGFDRVAVAGGGGGRLDHLLGIVSLFERAEPPLCWYTAREYIQAFERELRIQGCRGQTVSFFPLTERVSGMSSRGLKWPLDGLRWRRGEMGVSNVFIEDSAVVVLGEGRLLMVRTIGEIGDAAEEQA